MRTGKREKDTDRIFGKQMMELRQWTKQQNKGMTLIEVLVVVAILAITVGIAGVSISLATSRDAEKSAKIINDALERSRMYAMSKTGTFEVIIDGSAHTVSIADAGETEELPAKVDIFFPDITDAGTAAITFDKSNGRVQSITVDGSNYTEKMLRISSRNQNGKTATVLLIVNTGKHYVEYN